MSTYSLLIILESSSLFRVTCQMARWVHKREAHTWYSVKISDCRVTLHRYADRSHTVLQICFWHKFANTLFLLFKVAYFVHDSTAHAILEVLVHTYVTVPLRNAAKELRRTI